MVIADHVCDRQTFHGNHLVVVDQPCAEFVQEIYTLIRNLGMNTGNFEPCFRSVLRPLLLPGQSALGPG
jgi:hypothetical protein